VLTWLLRALLAVAVTACAVSSPRGGWEDVLEEAAEPRVLDARGSRPLGQVVPRLAEARVVFVGETHDRYDHHLAQLAVIRALHARRPSLAIGLEAFQQPFQPALDDYVAGRIDDRELLKRTEYYDRWGYDYRLYQPILDFAREKGLPLVALNVPRELTRRVGQVGLDGLEEAERAALPTRIDRSDGAYEERLRAVFAQHPEHESLRFERWLDVQLVWDEGMAEQAARFLAAHPDRPLVMLAGSGHLAWRSGIPRRLERWSGARSVLLLPADVGPPDPALADYLMLTEERPLPPGGRLGVRLDPEDGGVVIGSIDPQGAAAAAGVREGDRVVSVDGAAVRLPGDVRVALWERRPGDVVTLELRRSEPGAAPEEIALPVTLR
jgi:uncharacterized iron-regulated protein